MQIAKQIQKSIWCWDGRFVWSRQADSLRFSLAWWNWDLTGAVLTWQCKSKLMIKINQCQCWFTGSRLSSFPFQFVSDCQAMMIIHICTLHLSSICQENKETMDFRWNHWIYFPMGEWRSQNKGMDFLKWGNGFLKMGEGFLNMRKCISWNEGINFLKQGNGFPEKR